MRRFLPLLSAMAALLLAFAVYAPGLHGAFVFDDGVNILNNDKLHIQALDTAGLKTATMSGTSGIFGRPVSMASFALDHWRSGGLDPYPYKLTNLLIHLATGIAVFAFVRLLLQAHQAHLPQHERRGALTWIALAVATVWLVHPLNLTSVLYVVQRMTSLAALFSLLGLASYLWGRLRLARAPSLRGWLAIGASFLVFTPLAALSKESGALLPLFLLLTEVAFFRFDAHSTQARRALLGMFALTVALPALAVLVHTIINPSWITTSYTMRTFTMGERLLTETRVLWLYLRLALVPDLSLLGLFHDDLVISKSLLEPITTLTSTIGLAALAAVVLAAWRRHRLLAYGIAFFLLGHSMESSFLALELMHEHRNYLPLIGLLVPLCYYLISASRYFDHKASGAIATFALIGIFAGITAMRASQWGDGVEMLVREVEHHPGSTRSQIALANFYNAMPARTQADANLAYQNAYKHFVLASEASPADPVGLFGLFTLHLRAGLPMEPTWLPALEGRIRNNPMAVSTVVAMMRLTDCYTNRVCKFEPAVMEALLRAALDNRRMLPQHRTQIMFSWSSFLFMDNRDPVAAKKAAYDAAALSPGNLQAQEGLVTTLYNVRLDDEARIEMEKLRRMDKLQLMTSKIDELNAALEKRRPGAQPTKTTP